VVSRERLVGVAAASFELADSEGRTVRMEDFAGAWLLLAFHRHLG